MNDFNMKNYMANTTLEKSECRMVFYSFDSFSIDSLQNHAIQSSPIQWYIT